MAGLYVHIPFCARACTYCDFHFTTRLSDRQAMVEALIGELRNQLPAWSGHTFRTLYFGGGTPSLLTPAELGDIARVAMEEANWELEEWTVEANPEDLDDGTLDAMKAAGIDRLSIGVQSFQPDVLAWMNRAHGAAGAKDAVERAAKAGFDHLSLDLIYGVPVGGAHRWKEDMDTACALPVDHLSCYILTAEPKTAYGHQLAKGDVSAPPDERVLDEYAALCATTRRCTSAYIRMRERAAHRSIARATSDVEASQRKRPTKPWRATLPAANLQWRETPAVRCRIAAPPLPKS